MASNRRRSASARARSANRPRVYTTPQSEGAALAATAPSKAARAVDWQAEYGYVMNDLRYLGLVSAALFVLLLVLGFFL
jgi:hypothetical protein